MTGRFLAQCKIFFPQIFFIINSVLSLKEESSKEKEEGEGTIKEEEKEEEEGGKKEEEGGGGGGDEEGATTTDENFNNGGSAGGGGTGGGSTPTPGDVRSGTAGSIRRSAQGGMQPTLMEVREIFNSVWKIRGHI